MVSGDLTNPPLLSSVNCPETRPATNVQRKRWRLVESVARQIPKVGGQEHMVPDITATGVSNAREHRDAATHTSQPSPWSMLLDTGFRRAAVCACARVGGRSRRRFQRDTLA